MPPGLLLGLPRDSRGAVPMRCVDMSAQHRIEFRSRIVKLIKIGTCRDLP